MMRRQGFTLIEVLCAVTILAIIMGIVYASFLSVTTATEAARVTMEELRTREFLSRVLTANLSAVYTDPYFENEQFRFEGTNNGGSHGPADALRFCSTAPLVGGMALPGDVKEVILQVEAPDSDMTLDLTAGTDEKKQFSRLIAKETPLLAGLVETGSAASSDASDDFVPDAAYEAAEWEIPTIRSMDIQYFDGKDWVEEWDSMDARRLPWCVRVTINFAKTEGQLEQERAEGISTEKDPDFEMYIPIPVGLGLTESSAFLPDVVQTDAAGNLAQQQALGAEGQGNRQQNRDGPSGTQRRNSRFDDSSSSSGGTGTSETPRRGSGTSGQSRGRAMSNSRGLE